MNNYNYQNFNVIYELVGYNNIWITYPIKFEELKSCNLFLIYS